MGPKRMCVIGSVLASTSCIVFGWVSILSSTNLGDLRKSDIESECLLCLQFSPLHQLYTCPVIRNQQNHFKSTSKCNLVVRIDDKCFGRYLWIFSFADTLDKIVVYWLFWQLTIRIHPPRGFLLLDCTDSLISSQQCLKPSSASVQFWPAAPSGCWGALLPFPLFDCLWLPSDLISGYLVLI